MNHRKCSPILPILVTIVVTKLVTILVTENFLHEYQTTGLLHLVLFFHEFPLIIFQNEDKKKHKGFICVSFEI